MVALLYGIAAANAIDRLTLSVLAPTLESTLGFSPTQYSYMVTAFLAAYTIGYLFAGNVLDRVGVRLGLGIALGVWSAVCGLHAIAIGWMSFAILRFLLGLSESFNSPGGMKAIAEWVPARERGLSTAIFSNGNVAGAVIAQPLIALAALHFGWRFAFVVPAMLGLVLLALWLPFYRSPATPAETPVTVAASAAISTRALLSHPACWGFILARFLTDPIAYFFNFWLPDYFGHARGFSLAVIGAIGWVPYLAGAFGGPGGGALSDWLVRRGWNPRAARFRLMLIAACFMPLSLVAVHAQAAWIAVAIVALLYVGQTCWMSNQLSLLSELFPAQATGKVVAYSAVGGSLGGILATLATGRVVQAHGYVPIFTVFAFLHLAAIAILSVCLKPKSS